MLKQVVPKVLNGLGIATVSASEGVITEAAHEKRNQDPLCLVVTV